MIFQIDKHQWFQVGSYLKLFDYKLYIIFKSLLITSK